jgi:para-aminobenzoate synthetase/4-amino-4-deoxychorismate lyase
MATSTEGICVKATRPASALASANISKVIEARFDDMTQNGESFRLVGPVGVLEANRIDEVAPTIAAAEAATARGLWVGGVVSYEAAPGLDPALIARRATPEDPFSRFPLAWFAMFEGREATSLPDPPDLGRGSNDAWLPTSDHASYDAALATIRERIAAGETYQVNHTIRLRSRVEGDERGLYRDLCYAQRGAHAAFLNMGRYRVLSASPELFLEIDGRSLTARPMKGTAPRGRWGAEDRAVRAGLVGSVKDRAENAMIVDLLRNDLGRVARNGTVTWSDVFEPERFETVWQLTSTVSCTLRADVGLVDVFRALFPSGSVTGAPKVRTMHIIEELETQPRNAYCGAVGFLAPEGSGVPTARFNVAIRTVVVDGETGAAEYGVGGGITWDSRAAGEYDEIVAKARVLTTRRPRFELLETLRAEGGMIRSLDRHLSRLLSSADYFGFAADESELRKALEAEAAMPREQPTRIRLVLDRRGHFTITSSPFPPVADTVRVALDTIKPVDPAEPMLFHKTTLRRRYEQAKARHPDVEDVVLTNVRGEVTEATIANVAVRIHDRWWTPALDSGLLPGTAREAMLEDGTLDERILTVEEFLAANEVALVSDARGWRRADVG